IALSISCQQEPQKDYVMLSGKIENAHDSKTLRIYKGKTYEKIITLNDDGSFNDTLKVAEGEYSIKHGDEYGNIYLKNGNISTLETDYEDFDNMLIYGGDGADINNFNIKSYLIVGDYFTDDLFLNPTQEGLDVAIKSYKDGYAKLESSYEDLDSIRKANGAKGVENNVKLYKNYFTGKIALRKALPKGSPSPTFENYENFKGGTTSLSDLKGKYVYVDVWATWCGPCKREIPSLKQLESKYHDRNIEFVSISVDDARRSGSDEKAYASWKKMVADKSLGGIQLFSDKAWKSDFMQSYKVGSIPRFILIDPDGNIVSPDAPRPSNPKLIELFDELSI
ncbi:MAG: TlpA disulfide reductase family protein, partial [Bacteroidota bacterium]